MIDPDMKDALKEALKEWLDAQASKFGWFAIRTLGAVALIGMVYFMLTWTGWKIP